MTEQLPIENEVNAILERQDRLDMRLFEIEKALGINQDNFRDEESKE